MNTDSAIVDSRAGFHEAVIAGLRAAAQTQAKEMWLVDEDFSGWPLGTPAAIAALEAWSAPHRRMVVLARDFASVERQHPRWVSWRRTHSHLVECFEADEAGEGDIPCALLVPQCVLVRLIDPVRWRGRVSLGGGADDVAMRERIDALLQRSRAGFPPTTLGL